MQLPFEFLDFFLQSFLHLFCGASSDLSLLPQSLKKVIDLLLHLFSHCFKFTIFQFFKLSQSLFIFIDERLPLSFEQLVHGSPLILVVLLHVSLLSLMLFAHVFDLLLQLSYDVAGLCLKHSDLCLKVLNFSLVPDPGFLGSSYLFLFLIFNPIDVVFQVHNFCLELLYLLRQFLDLFLHVAVCGFEDIVQPIYLGVKPLAL